MNQLFAQRRNLFRPRHYRMLKDILRFNRDANQALAERPGELARTSVAEIPRPGPLRPRVDQRLPAAHDCGNLVLFGAIH